MKYFYDTEFLEGAQKKRWWSIEKVKPTIDLISIGIVCEDGREYYAISKDFNLKEAWNRYDVLEQTPFEKYNGFKGKKSYWIRENVLIPIFFELAERDFHNIHFKDEWIYEGKIVDLNVFKTNDKWTSDIAWFKKIINKYGKTNNQISKEIKNFCYLDKETIDNGGQIVSASFIPNKYPNIQLYGYYSAYDHVALCWLFGKMIDLPKGMPMITHDLKQNLNEVANTYLSKTLSAPIVSSDWHPNYALDNLKQDFKSHYPKQENEHNALSDAKWNFELYKFLEKV